MPMSAFQTIVISFVLSTSASCQLACTSQLIPNTDVADTVENRKIIEVGEQYRRAVEDRRVGRLLHLAHPKDYEHGGNIDAADDIDRAGLKEFLEDRFRSTSAIRYEIRYRRVQVSKERKVTVDYTFSASYKIPGPSGEEIWHRQVADNRLELVPQDDSYLILSGM